jgi:sterol desaturase/sphingolipid hydroxylase (fatty acid hydroxylase superfamily)
MPLTTFSRMRTRRFLGWSLSLLSVCGLVLLVRWHGELQTFAHAHRNLTFFLFLSLLLTIPARFIALAAAYLLELLLVGWSRSSLRMLCAPQPSVKLDLLATLATVLFESRHLGYLLSFGLLYAADVYEQRHIDISITRLLPLSLLPIVFFIPFNSFLRYWLHRLEHSVPALWALHQFHHSADRMSILASARQTQLGVGVERAIVLLPAAFLITPAAKLPSLTSPYFVAVLLYFVYDAFMAINGYLCHSNLTTGYGWIGRWLIVSPRMHRLHHAVTPAYYNRNFSFDLVIWDRIFGTYAQCEAGTDIATIPVGLDHNPYNNLNTTGGILREYFLTTYIVFWREIKKMFRTSSPARLVPGQSAPDFTAAASPSSGCAGRPPQLR